MTIPWTEYVIRRRAEGWRWGWQFNEQLKTDPAMQPPIGEPFVRTHEPSDLDRPYPILPRQREGDTDVSSTDSTEHIHQGGTSRPKLEDKQGL